MPKLSETSQINPTGLDADATGVFGTETSMYDSVRGSSAVLSTNTKEKGEADVPAVVSVADAGSGISTSASLPLHIRTTQARSSYTRIVPAGSIIHIYRHHGRYAAAEIDFNHPALNRLVPRLSMGAEDHHTTTHKIALNALRHQMRYQEGAGGDTWVDAGASSKAAMGYHSTAEEHIPRQVR